MKKFLKKSSLLVIIISPLFSLSQIYTGRIDSVKDGDGVICTYIGEIKNNKPNGRGLLIYPEGKNAFRHTGYFSNGMANGKGIILFNGAFNCGTFLTGKLDGKIAFRSGSTFGVEMVVSGISNGITTAVTDNNMVLFFRKKTDIEQGSKLYVDANGLTFYHKYMQNGMQAGSQIQYEVKNSSLYEGYWKDDKWIKQPITFKSMLKDKNFKSFKNDKAVGMGIFNQNNAMSDTGFLMSADGNERYFGKFSDGNFISGVQIFDGVRFIGKMKEGKAQGDCFFFKEGGSFLRGNYIDNVLNDSSCFFLNLENNTTYIGGAVNGAFEGKGISSTMDNILFIGTFKNNGLNGECTKVYPSGYSIMGRWQKDSLVAAEKASDPNGKIFSLTPKTMEEGIAALINHIKQLRIYNSSEPSEKKYSFHRPEDIAEKVAYKSLFRLPSSEYDEIITRMEKSYVSGFSPFQSEYFISTYKSGVDSMTAIKYFDGMCGQLKQLQLTLKPGTTPVKLSEKNVSYKSSYIFKIFEIPENARPDEFVTIQACIINENGQPDDFSVVLLIRTGDVQFFK